MYCGFVVVELLTNKETILFLSGNRNVYQCKKVSDSLEATRISLGRQSTFSLR